MSLKSGQVNQHRWRVSPRLFGLGQALPESNLSLCQELKFRFKFVYSLRGLMICQTMFCIGIFYFLMIKETVIEDRPGNARDIPITLQCSSQIKNFLSFLLPSLFSIIGITGVLCYVSLACKLLCLCIFCFSSISSFSFSPE